MEEMNIDTADCKYALLVGEGAYFADSVFGLVWEVLRHRFQHLMRGDGWVD